MLVLVARDVAATDPAAVRVHLHRRGDDASVVTYVDIAVQGAETPIRVIRRVDGTCTVFAVDSSPSLVRIDCGPAVRFEVVHARMEVIVRRTAPPDSDAGDPEGWMVIARARLARNTAVVLADPDGQRAPRDD